MPSRYATTKNIKDDDGVRRASTTIIPVIPRSDADVFIRTTTVERLDLLANQFYSDATMWWAIAGANGLGKGTLYVAENTRLRIPDITTVTDIITSKNASR